MVILLVGVLVTGPLGVTASGFILADAGIGLALGIGSLTSP
jgi:hypothetical protein